MNIYVPRERANRASEAGGEAHTQALRARSAVTQREPSDAPSDTLARSLNEGAAVQSLAQLRAALDGSPRLQGQAVLQRALNAAAPSGPGVLQLARLNVRRDGSNTISGVSAWPHRPASNVRGSQGQHLTAYVAFTDMILSRVRDRTVPEAANALIDLLDRMSELLGGEQWNRTYGATVEENKRLLRGAARDNNADVVGGVIDNILALRNVMPDTAIATAERTWGHGEAGTSGSLEVLESALRTDTEWPQAWGTDNEVANQAMFNMWRLLDYQPPSNASETQFNKTKNRVYRHLVQMRLSYPSTFDWLSERGDRLLTYIKENRDEDGMPLTDLSDGEIDDITSFIMG